MATTADACEKGGRPMLIQSPLRNEVQKLRDTCSDFEDHDYLATLTKILHVAITITSADKGNIQLLDPLSRDLRIVVHESLAAPFIQFFNAVNHRTAACGTAMKLLERVVVEDVRQSPLFIGTEALQVLLEAGVMAVQSTPLINKDQYIVGVISTHYRVPTIPTREQLRLLDELAEIAAEFINRVTAQSGGTMFRTDPASVTPSSITTRIPTLGDRAR